MISWKSKYNVTSSILKLIQPRHGHFPSPQASLTTTTDKNTIYMESYTVQALHWLFAFNRIPLKFSQVLGDTKTSYFFWMLNKIPWYRCTSLFNQSPNEGPLGYLQLWILQMQLLKYSCTCFCVDRNLHFSGKKKLKSVICGSHENCMFILFHDAVRLFSSVVVPFYKAIYKSVPVSKLLCILTRL